MRMMKELKGIGSGDYNEIPKFTHDFGLLMKQSKTEFPEAMEETILRLSPHCLGIRCPEEIAKFRKYYDRAFATKFLADTEVIRVQRIILYGSYAYGKPHDGSDIDLVVISRDFRMPPLERLEFLSLARRESKNQIEALGYTPAEFKKAKQSVLLDEVVERGIVVYEALEESLTK